MPVQRHASGGELSIGLELEDTFPFCCVQPDDPMRLTADPGPVR